MLGHSPAVLVHRTGAQTAQRSACPYRGPPHSDGRQSSIEWAHRRLLEHEAVAEAAVVPAPDPLRPAVPEAYIVLAEGWEPGPDTAKALFAHFRAMLAPYKRIRRLEFADLPKTVSGKIRRIELRERTAQGGGIEFHGEI